MDTLTLGTEGANKICDFPHYQSVVKSTQIDVDCPVNSNCADLLLAYCLGTVGYEEGGRNTVYTYSLLANNTYQIIRGKNITTTGRVEKLIYDDF